MGDARLDSIGALAGQFGGHIANVGNNINVIAGAAKHRVGTGCAVEHIVAAKASEGVAGAVAGDVVDRSIADAADGQQTGQRQVLDFGRQRVGDARLDGIDAAQSNFGDHVTGIVDHIDIAAGAAGHRIGTSAAIEGIGFFVAGQAVVEFIAGPVDCGQTGEHQILEIGAQSAGDARLYGVVAFARGLGDHIARIVDNIGIIAQATNHGIQTQAAIKGVVAQAAIEGIIAGEAVENVFFDGRQWLASDGLGRVYNVGTACAVDDYAANIGYGDCDRLSIHQRPVGSLNLNVIDIVGTGIGWLFTVRSGIETKYTGHRIDGEKGQIGTAGERVGDYRGRICITCGNCRNRGAVLGNIHRRRRIPAIGIDDRSVVLVSDCYSN